MKISLHIPRKKFDYIGLAMPSNTQKMITRRNFLRSSAATGAIAGFPFTGVSAEKLKFSRGQRPKHIIHLVADGMSMGTLTCADHLAQIMRNGRGLTWVTLKNNPAVASSWVNMRSLNSLVTDSSAAASSWGSGSRIINGAVNQLPDGRDLTTIYQLFAQAGWKRGLVTTTEITHATPAGFAANAEERNGSDKIAKQYIDRRVDLMLGGGQKFFDPKERKDKLDLRGEARKADYHYMETKEELYKAPLNQRWLGLFDKSHLPFTVDQIYDEKLRAKVPTLAEMTQRALEWLGRHPHFILQVEGGRVDHGCHNCDAAAALRDMIAFDEALDVCLEFQKKVKDTLIVITTDHGNGNMGLNGMGDAYGQSSFLFDNVLRMQKSFPELLKLMRKTEKVKEGPDYEAKIQVAKKTNPRAYPDVVEKPDDLLKEEEEQRKKEEREKKEDEEAAAKLDPKKDEKKEKEKKKEKDVIIVKPTKEIIDAFRTYTGYKLDEKRANHFAPFLSKKGVTLFDMMNNETAALGQVLSNHLGISFTGTAHTADYVLLTAVGPGAELFRGFLQNTDVFYNYLSLAKIDFRNPTEPLAADYVPTPRSLEDLDEYTLA